MFIVIFSWYYLAIIFFHWKQILRTSPSGPVASKLLLITLCTNLGFLSEFVFYNVPDQLFHTTDRTGCKSGGCCWNSTSVRFIKLVMMMLYSIVKFNCFHVFGVCSIFYIFLYVQCLSTARKTTEDTIPRLVAG